MIGRFQGILQSTTLENRLVECEAKLDLVYTYLHEAEKETQKLKRYIIWLKAKIAREKLNDIRVSKKIS